MALSFQVGEFIFIPSLNQLQHQNQVYKLEPKVVDLLLFFVRHPDNIASREEIRCALWGNISVSDHAINRIISQLRKALSDNQAPHQYIETVAKRGYRLVAKVHLLVEEEVTDTLKTKAIFQHKYLWFVLTIVIIILCTIYAVANNLFSNEKVLEIHGGTIKQISAMPGREWAPAYSSNNQWLTFLHFDKVTKRFHIMLKRDQQVVASSVFSTEKKISDYYWLPHQDRLLLATFDGKHCLIEQLTLSKSNTVLAKTSLSVSCGQRAARAVAWSKADKNIYWINHSGELYRQKMSTQQLPFTHENSAVNEQVSSVKNAYRFSLSSNGKYLALIKDHQKERSEIELYNIESNQLETIFTSQLLIHALSWDNLNQHLLFVENNSIRKITLQGKVSDVGFNSENDIYSMHYNAQRSQLLYTTSNTKYQLMHLTQQKNGKYKEQLPRWRSQLNERNPIYSHSGKSIAYISQMGGQYGISIKEENKAIHHLKLKNLDLSQTLIRWSFDDQQLLFHSKQSLFIYSLVTNKYRKITNDNIYADVVAWSYRDPNNIYFRSDLDGQMNIWLLNIHSGNTKKVTQKGGFSGHESKDGQYFYYSKEVEDGLWQLNLSTNEEVLWIKGFSRFNHLSWYLVEQGIYYLYSQAHIPSIYYYSFNSQREQLIWRYKPWIHGGFTIAPDEQDIYLGLKEQSEWNIMSINTKYE